MLGGERETHRTELSLVRTIEGFGHDWQASTF